MRVERERERERDSLKDSQTYRKREFIETGKKSEFSNTYIYIYIERERER